MDCLRSLICPVNSRIEITTRAQNALKSLLLDGTSQKFLELGPTIVYLKLEIKLINRQLTCFAK